MHPAARGFVGVIAGLVVGALLVFAIQMVSHLMFAPSTPVDRNDRAAVERFIAGLPLTAFLMVLLAYFIGTVVGASTAARIGRSTLPSIIVTLLLFGAAVSNLVMIPHPTWMVVAVPVVYAIAGFIAWKLSSDLRAAASA